jgi:polar amino acid transport system substrate-binding protein
MMKLYALKSSRFLMKRCLLKLAFTIAFLWTFSLHASDKIIRVRADSWCPYNCDPLSHVKQGSMIEILQKALEPAGYTIDYNIMPWEESLKAGRTGEIDAVVGLTMGDGAGFQLPAETLGVGITCFYGKKGGELERSGFRLTRIEQLHSQRIVVPSGYVFVDSLQKHLDTYKDDPKKILWVSSSWPLVDAYRAVFQGNADLFPENEAVIDNLMLSLGIRGGGQIVSWDAWRVRIFMWDSARNERMLRFWLISCPGRWRRCGRVENCPAFFPSMGRRTGIVGEKA